MRILSRYIAAMYLKIFALCLGAFVAIFLVVDFLEKIRRFTSQQAEPQFVIGYFLCKIPEIISLVTPLAVLMATLLALGILSRNSEITAMRSCGISIQRISAPILGIAFLVSIFTMVSNELIIPVTSQKMQYIEDVLIAKKSSSTSFRQNNIWYREKNLILQARFFEPKTHSFKGVTLWQLGEGMQPLKRIDADQGILTGGHVLFKAVVERELANGEVVRTLEAKEIDVDLNLKTEDLQALDKFADNMGFFDLRRYGNKLRAAGYDATPYLAKMHARVSYPFASLIMAFLGIPFALRGGRSSGIAMGIGISLGIGFAYFVINAVILAYGAGGILPPLVAAWAPNGIFAMGGIWLALNVDN